jgi:hypothetical protein
MTWSLWIFLAIVYLVFAVILITYSLFSKTGPLSRIGRPRYLKRHASQICSNSADVDIALAMIRAKRDLARRALTVRVLGYICVPVICVFPGVVNDLLTRARPDLNIPSVVPLAAVITAGLMGALNSILISFDPSIVGVVFWPYWKKKKEQERSQEYMNGGRRPLDPPASALKLPTLGDIEMAETKVIGNETQEAVVATVHFENAETPVESHGHSETGETIDFENSRRSTTFYDMRDLAETYHGL